MKDKSLQPGFWIIVLAILCCGLPLLIITGGGSILAFISGFLNNNTLVLLLGLALAGLAVWIFLKERRCIKTMNDQSQNTCMACSCPCEMHKEHNHPTEQADEQQEHSMTCSKCGLKAKSKEEMEGHGKAHQGGQM